VPGSWVGIFESAGCGLYRISGISGPVDGSFGTPYTGEAKSNAAVRSPQTLRRQALMLGETAGVPSAVVHFSRTWITEVWSVTSEVTQPPRVQGEIRMRGTRNPRPTGRLSPCRRRALIVPLHR
jgi:hypothetical protein